MEKITKPDANVLRRSLLEFHINHKYAAMELENEHHVSVIVSWIIHVAREHKTEERVFVRNHNHLVGFKYAPINRVLSAW